MMAVITCYAQEDNEGGNNGSETFEGIVKYKFLMDDARDLTDDQIEEKIKQVEEFFGRYMVYYVKEPKMKSVTDGMMLKMTSYTDNTDSMYLHTPDMGDLAKVSTYDNWGLEYDTITRQRMHGSSMVNLAI